MRFECLKTCVENAISRIYREDAYLIKYGLSEWTISAQFHYYMRLECQHVPELKGYSFDSEYNFMSKISDKGLAAKYICVGDEKLRVRPDFIIHKRGSSSNNYLWVEMKRVGGWRWKKDLNRVLSVTKTRATEGGVDYVTGYSYGLGILFHKKEVQCNWYANGSDKLMQCGYVDSSGIMNWSDQSPDIRRHLSMQMEV